MTNSFDSGVAGGATVAIIIKAIDEYSGEIEKAKNEITLFGEKTNITSNQLNKLAIGAFAVAGAVAKLAYDSSEAMDVQEAYNKIVGDNKIWMQMQKNVLGTIDKYKLMATANEAVNKGIKKENIPILTDYAMRLKDAGIIQESVTDAVNDFSTAIATGRTMTLARLGIQIDVNEIYEEYAQKLGIATEALSELEKKEALQNAIMQQVGTKKDELPIPVEDAADKIEQLKTKINELKVMMGESFGPIAMWVIDNLIKGLNLLQLSFLGIKKAIIDIQIWMLEASASIEKAWKVSWASVGNFFKIIWNEVLDFLERTINKIIDGLNKLSKPVRKLLGIDGEIGKVNFSGGKLNLTDINSIKSEIDSRLGSNLAPLLIKREQAQNEIDSFIANNIIKQKENTEALIENTRELAKLSSQQRLIQGGYMYIPSTGDIYNPKWGSLLRSDFGSDFAFHQAGMGGGISITIDNVYGLDPTEIAQALSNKLNNQISL
jgi:hypothetical protein